MKKIKVVICMIMAIMLSFSAIPVGAIELTVIDPIYKGTVALANSETLTRFDMSTVQDLSGIEVKVYSAEEIVSKYDDGSDFIYYGLTYDHSVYTDADGAFSFETPSKYFSYSVELSTLPAGYGIDKKSEFCYPNDRMGVLSVSAIASIDTEYSNGDIVVTIYDAQKNIINAEYTVSENAVSAIAYDELAEFNEMVFTGTVNISSVIYEYSESVDISEMSVVEKIDTLYSVGAISESTQIEYYCYALQDESVEMTSSTSIISKIRKYQSENGISTCDLNLQAAFLSTNEQVYMASVNTTESYYGSIGTFDYVIDYDPSLISSNDAARISSELNEIYTYFVINNGFNAPIPHDSSGVYKINVVSSIGNDVGRTLYSVPDGSTYRIASNIEILYDVVTGTNIDSAQLDTVLAHEFFHAIMATYVYDYFSGDDYRWFRDGCATMAAYIYTGNNLDSLTNHYLEQYLSNIDDSLYELGENIYKVYGGGMIYMYYIHRNLGGWNAIKSILNNININTNVYQAITNSPYISTYDAAFLAAATRTYDMDYFYDISLDNDPVLIPYRFSDGETDNLYLPPMAFRFHNISPGSSSGTLGVFFNVENSGIGFQLNVIKKSGSTQYTIATAAYDFTYDSYYISNFGAGVSKVALCPVNTNTTGNDMTYHFHASIS